MDRAARIKRRKAIERDSKAAMKQARNVILLAYSPSPPLPPCSCLRLSFSSDVTAHYCFFAGQGNSYLWPSADGV